MDNNVYELHGIYDNSFNKLTEKYYQKQAWPEAEVIASLVNDGTLKKYRKGKKKKITRKLMNILVIDQVFLTLYRELYYRHVYSHLTPSLEHRFRSYENYCDLFNYILSK